MSSLELPPDMLAALLERVPVARLATVTPAGSPHVLPVVFVAGNGCLYSPVDAKRKAWRRDAPRELARVRNVLAHGRASLLLDGYQSDWMRLWWVRLDGPARVERDDPELLSDIGSRLRAKYSQYRTVAPYSGQPTLLVVRYEHVSAWTQTGDLAAIREAAGLG